MMSPNTPLRRGCRLAAAGLCAALIAAGPAAPSRQVHAAQSGVTSIHATPGTAVTGTTTTWQIALVKLRALDRIPHTSYVGYGRSRFTRFYVLNLRITNTGTRATSPQSDLILAMKVRPPDPEQGRPGYGEVDPTDKPLHVLVVGAARDFGGALPTTVARPGTAVEYSYLIEVFHPYQHYGLYNFEVHNGRGKYVYVLGLGV